MDSHGVPQTFIVSAPPTALRGSLRQGQVLQGTVRGEAGNLSLHVAGTRVPLGAATPLTPGLNVRVQVAASETGLQLHITAHQEPGAASPPSASLPTALASILRAFPAIEALPNPEVLLPANMPPTEAALRQLFTLLAQRDSIARDLHYLISVISQAAQAGAVTREYFQDFAALWARFVARNDESFESILQHLAQQGGDTLEAQMAKLLASGRIEELLERLRTSLRGQVAQLRGNEALMKYVRGTRQLAAFENALHGLFERLAAGQLQNLRSLEQSYLFLELPFATGAGMGPAQIHFFGDGHAKGRRFDAANARVVIDLATSKLGDLWIALDIVRKHCTCTIRAVEPEIVEALRASGGELRDALAEAGYANARVTVGGWNGNRLEAIAGMVQRFRGFDTAI